MQTSVLKMLLKHVQLCHIASKTQICGCFTNLALKSLKRNEKKDTNLATAT